MIISSTPEPTDLFQGQGEERGVGFIFDFHGLKVEVLHLLDRRQVKSSLLKH